MSRAIVPRGPSPRFASKRALEGVLLITEVGCAGAAAICYDYEMLSPSEIAAALTTARDSWRFTDEELAVRADVEPAALARALKGDAAVADLASLANALGGTFDELVAGRRFWEAPSVAFRGAPLKADLPAIRSALLKLSRVARDRAWLATALELPVPDHRLSPVAPAADVPRQAEALAQKVREALGNPLEPIACARASMRRLGIATFLGQFGADDVDGMSFRDENVAAAAANIGAGEGAVTRLRMTFAHELCHLLFDGTKGVPLGFIDRRGDAGGASLEQRANAFAAYFLAPRDAVLQFLRERGWKSGDKPGAQDVLALSEHFIIGVEAVAWQLVNCRLWEASDVARHRHLATRSLQSEDDAELRPRDAARIVPLERRGEILELSTLALERGVVGAGRWRELIGVDAAADWLRVLQDREVGYDIEHRSAV